MGLGMDNLMAGFNPYLIGFPQTANPLIQPPWFGAAAGMASASSFHAPGAKNEIKLFVGGLQFQTQGTYSP